MLGTSARHDSADRPERRPRSTSSHSTPRRGSTRGRIVVASAATAFLALGSIGLATPANAVAAPRDGDPVGDLVGQVTHIVEQVTKPKAAPKAQPKSKPRSTSSGGSSSHGSSSTGHSSRPDHASGSAASVGLGKAPVAGIAQGKSSAGKKSSTADATLLAIGGLSIIGSHADSSGPSSASGPVPEIPLCAPTDGALCLNLLYADSKASKTSHSKNAGTSTGVADLCVGGDDPTGKTCDGIGAGVLQNRTKVHTDANGANRSTSSSSVLNACAADDNSCLIAGDVLGSSSESGRNAENENPTLASILLGDLPVDAPDDPIAVEVPKGCDTEILCAVLNGVDPGASTDSRGAGNVDALDGNGTAGIAGTETGSSAHDTGTPPTTSTPRTGTQGGSATGSVGDVGLGDQPILGLSQNESKGTLTHTTGDATLLSLFGNELIGSHANSDGQTEGHGPVPPNLLCDVTGGAICLDLLYADSSATEDADGSQANTQTGVLGACLLGSDATGESCDGIEAGAVQGESFLVNDKTTGITQAGSTTSLAQLCIHGDDACTVAADALKSESYADSTGLQDSSSSIADVMLDGTEIGAPGDPIEFSVPTDCPSDNIACVFLNQVTAEGEGGTSAGATVVGVTGLGDTLGTTVSTTQVTATGGTPVVEPPVVDPPVVDPPVVDPPSNDNPTGDTAAAASGVLPNTGGVRSGVLGLGLLMVAAGAAVLTASRRRQSA